jgi:hypothetical protein
VALPWFTVAQKTRKCVALQSDLGRPAAARKIFRFAFPANQLPLLCVLPERGALAIVTNVGRDAVDAFATQDERR